LLDYLSQLLGQDGEAVKSFVENVEKFQRGENLVQTNGGSQQQPKLQLAPRQSQDSYTTGKAPVKAKNAWQDNAKKQQGRGNKQQPKKPTVPAAKKLAAPAAQVNKPPPVAKKTPPVAVATKQPVESKKKVAAPKLPPKKSHPKKGKASHVCGCFGTIHKPLANCLYCGRVSCYNEGFDFCAFCGLMVEKVDVEAPKEGYVVGRYLLRRIMQPIALFEGLRFGAQGMLIMFAASLCDINPLSSLTTISRVPCTAPRTRPGCTRNGCYGSIATLPSEQ
jgi:pyruvate/2-oxoglutarate dehydrogenase complex dihydrolipoamide acyltransferase (E2) component